MQIYFLFRVCKSLPSVDHQEMGEFLHQGRDFQLSELWFMGLEIRFLFEGMSQLEVSATTSRHSSDRSSDRFDAIQSSAFFWMSTACVNLPTSCSSCAIRSVEASDCLRLESKRVAAFSRSWRFHCESCSSVMLCRRQSSASELSTLSASITTFALNSGVNLLRFRLVLIGCSLSMRLLLSRDLGLACGSNFRWQYTTGLRC